jgi:hypothetical protein
MMFLLWRCVHLPHWQLSLPGAVQLNLEHISPRSSPDENNDALLDCASKKG